MTDPTALSKSLEELEGDDWDGDEEYAAFLGAEGRRLYRLPLGRLSAADLALLIGRNVGLRHLIPLAIDCLEPDPFMTDDPGGEALLRAVVGSGPRFWRDDPESASRVQWILAGAEAEVESRSKLLRESVSPAWRR